MCLDVIKNLPGRSKNKMFNLKFIVLCIVPLVINYVNCDPLPSMAPVSPIPSAPNSDDHTQSGGKLQFSQPQSDPKVMSTYPQYPTNSVATNAGSYSNPPTISGTINHLYQKPQAKYEVVDTNYKSYSPDVISELKNDVITLRENINLLVGMQGDLINKLKEKAETDTEVNQSNDGKTGKTGVHEAERKDVKNDFNPGQQPPPLDYSGGYVPAPFDYSGGYAPAPQQQGYDGYEPSSRTFNLLPTLQNQGEKQASPVFVQPVQVVKTVR